MKHSIRLKMTLLLTTIVVLTIFITWYINNAFLSKYYIYIKTKNLDEAYKEVVDIYNASKDTDNLSDADTDKVDRLEIKYDVNIYVYNSDLVPSYPSPENFGKREQDLLKNRLMEFFIPGSNPNIQGLKVISQKSKDYFIYKLYDKQSQTNYMELIGKFSVPDTNTQNGTGSSNQSTQDGTPDYSSGSNPDDSTDGGTTVKPVSGIESMVLLRSNLESIEESASIANEFLAFVGIAAVVMGTLAMFLLSKNFTKPIKDLSGIAKKMSELDFEVKYDVKSKDEVGELGNSINSLSDKLESTITELKQANNELMTDIQKKTEIDEMRKEFLSNVSHELKTPISLIQGYAEGLKENINEDEESRDYYCEVIMDEADKMNKMVKKLLSLNELEFGNNQVNFERFDIVTLIKSVLSSTEILFKQKEVTLHFEQKDPIYVWADEYLIEQVVTNYISNALNHVSGQKIIEIKLIPREDTVRVAVFNTGDNIPEEELDKIWIKFYKVDKARTREYGGSGIGLSIVKAIMNSHNRECGVINRAIGVEFWFELDAKS